MGKKYLYVNEYYSFTLADLSKSIRDAILHDITGRMRCILPDSTERKFLAMKLTEVARFTNISKFVSILGHGF